MLRRMLYQLLLVLSIWAFICNEVDGVVVDGEKKPGISPLTRQSDEKSSIDPYNTKTCGINDANLKEHEFVSMAREGQFPWIVSFQIKVLQNSKESEQKSAARETKEESVQIRKKDLEDLHFCSGSFISDRWILSAAHCFAPETIQNYLENRKLFAVAGSHKVSSAEPLNRNLTIERVYLHSSFDKSMPVGFDIALVELKDPVVFAQKRKLSGGEHQTEPFMNTICLPLKDKQYKFNETARLAGWGLSAEKDASSMPTKLLTTDIIISNTDECIKNYVKSLKSDKPKVHMDKYNDVICGGYRNTRDACQSDSGGPLMQYSSRKAVVVGIVSYGIGCATRGVPALYTRTSAYINWIRDITTNKKDASVEFRVIEAKNRPQDDHDKPSREPATTKTPMLMRNSTSSSTTMPPVSHEPQRGDIPMTTIVPMTLGSANKAFKFYDERK